MMRFIPSCSSPSQWRRRDYLSVISGLFVKVHDGQEIGTLTRLIARPDKQIFFTLSCRRIGWIRVRNICLARKVKASYNEQYAQRQEPHLVKSQPSHCLFPPLMRDVLTTKPQIFYKRHPTFELTRRRAIS